MKNHKHEDLRGRNHYLVVKVCFPSWPELIMRLPVAEVFETGRAAGAWIDDEILKCRPVNGPCYVVVKLFEALASSVVGTWGLRVQDYLMDAAALQRRWAETPETLTRDAVRRVLQWLDSGAGHPARGVMDLDALAASDTPEAAQADADVEDQRHA